MDSSTLPKPPYYAVIFVNQRTDQDDVGYSDMAERMVELAQQQDGFLAIESVREASGKGITISYWKDKQAIADWKNNVEHQEARKLGKDNWYQDFQLQVAKVEHGYRWIRN